MRIVRKIRSRRDDDDDSSYDTEQDNDENFDAYVQNHVTYVIQLENTLSEDSSQ